MPIFGNPRDNANDRKAKHREDVEGRKIDRRVRSLEQQTRSGETRRLGGQVVRSMGRGFGDIARSLATPTTRRRPRIAQLPLQDADISQPIDLEKMKHPTLRGRDIRGRRNL